MNRPVSPFADPQPAARAGTVWWPALLVLGLVLACSLPAVPQPADYHAFADQRVMAGLPHALNVWSNLPFLAMGGLGLLVLHGVGRHLSGRWCVLGGLLSAGLLATALWSAQYHLLPCDQTLVLDRLGMALAFAGLLGMAAADRVDGRTGMALAATVLAGGVVSLLVWHATGNVLPWAVLQGGCMLLLLGLAQRPVADEGLGLPLWRVLGLYGLAKLLELADAPLFQATGGLLSGHTLKHVVAALAVWPLWMALAQGGHAKTPQPAGTMAARCGPGRARRA